MLVGSGDKTQALSMTLPAVLKKAKMFTYASIQFAENPLSND